MNEEARIVMPPVNIARSESFFSGLTRLLFTLFISCLSLTCFAQHFEQNPADYYSFEPVFKQSYIVSHHIKAIKASLVYKRDNQQIEDKGLSKSWEYDSTGLLRRYYATSVRGFTTREIIHPSQRRGRRISPAYTSQEQIFNYDTSFVYFHYNSQKQIIIRRARDGDYYNSVYYEYDAAGNIKRQSVFRETNANGNSSVFRLGVQTLLSAEEFRYEKNNPHQLRRRHFNDEGKEYRQTVYNFDTQGRLQEESSSFTVSWMRASLKLVYDINGRLTKKVYTSNENGEETSSSDYTYTAGNLVDVERRYKGEVLNFELNYIYDRQNSMLLSHFVREHLNKAILIARYEYDYF